MFQHTAARRRLPEHKLSFVDTIAVSTHSRTEAAAIEVFTEYVFKRFQHTAARRRLHPDRNPAGAEVMFQHTAARRRLQQEI